MYILHHVHHTTRKKVKFKYMTSEAQTMKYFCRLRYEFFFFCIQFFFVYCSCKIMTKKREKEQKL